MDKLTYRAYPSGKAYLNYGLDAIWKKKLKNLRYDIIEKAVDRLAEYEDTNLTPAEVAELAQAKADGRVVVLPCKVGDTVYCIHNSCIELCKVEAVHFALRSYIRLKPFKQPYLVYHSICYTPLLSSFGKIVFLTREEAEKALKECESK